MNEKRYCVYVHRRLDNNKIFYVGNGSVRRPYASCKYTRSKKWIQVVADCGGRSVEIVKQGLTKDQAVRLETYLINCLSGLINSSNNSPREYPDYDYFSKFVRYDKGSPSGLVRADVKGTIIGYSSAVNNKNYWFIEIEGRKYRASRIVCILHKQTINKGLVVDHVDGNGLNNSIENLRICTQAENMWTVNTRNSQFPGVKFNVKDKRWIAQWQERRKQKEKGFSVRKYGHEKAKELAINYRLQMIEMLK